jgi:membrane protease YdiL (CAAX protease family)
VNTETTSGDTHVQHYQSWAERNGFADWVLALLWIVAAFILFQLTANVVGLVLIAIQEGVSSDPMEMMKLAADNLDLLFIGSSTGQILFLGLGTWFVARLHSSKKNRKQFLRFTAHSDTLRKIGVTIVLIIAVQPVIWFLSWLNAFIPVPEAFSNLQNSQMEMIENYLRGDHLLLITLFHVALVPAICEETLYRGYVMSAFKKSWSIWPAIIVSGLLFGLYHVQLSNLIPLATLGMLFAYITWITESIYPAIVAHLVNNGGSVMIATYYPESAFAEITPETMPPLWGVILSLLITAYIVYWMYIQHTKSSA